MTTMTLDEIGELLEHNGATDDEIDAYLEHFGKKGMKWGVRKAIVINKSRDLKGKERLKKSQYVGNKATRGAAYVASWLVGGAAGRLAGYGLTRNPMLASVTGIAGSAGAVVATNKILKSVGSHRISDVRKGSGPRPKFTSPDQA